VQEPGIDKTAIKIISKYTCTNWKKTGSQCSHYMIKYHVSSLWVKYKN